MLRKLLVLLCVVCAVTAIAQKKTKTRPAKTKQTESKQNKEEIDYKQVGTPMPDLVFVPFYDSASKVPKSQRKNVMTNKDFDNGANLIVMMFNPTCGHCQEQTLMMGRNDDWFKKTKVVLLATLIMKPYLQDFATFTEPSAHSYMYLGVDSTDFINNIFLYQQLPQINIYDRERKLLKTYTGNVPMDTLKQFIE